MPTFEAGLSELRSPCYKVSNLMEMSVIEIKRNLCAHEAHKLARIVEKLIGPWVYDVTITH